MDQLETCLEALKLRTATVERQLRWRRGLAGGRIILGLLSWTLPSGPVQEGPVAATLQPLDTGTKYGHPPQGVHPSSRLISVDEYTCIFFLRFIPKVLY
jgi:hypothetical protein